MSVIDPNEIISIMDEIRAEVDALAKPVLDKRYLQRGFELSRNSIRQKERVETTPIGKNVLKVNGFPEGKYLQVDEPLTDGEKRIYLTIRDKLTAYIGPEVTKYDLNRPIDDPQHYVVDCWRNLKENMRDIQPGQYKQRVEAFQRYMKPSRDMGVRELLRTSPEFRKAVEMVYEILPRIKAADDIVEISAPFLKKHTNTTYPYWLNDRTIIPGTGRTAGEVTMSIAERIMRRPDWYKLMDNFAVWTALARDQRGKGRALIASSRPMNLILNLIESPEIQACKDKCPPFAGYNPPEELKTVLIRMCEDCKKNSWWATNWDQSSYDQHISRDLIELIGALGVLKSSGSKTRQLVIKRAVLSSKGWLVYGENMTIVEIFGRIFSGGLDTNLGGGKMNLIISIFCDMICDPKYSSIWYTCKYPMLVMGDDNLQIHNHNEHEKYVKAMADIGFEVNPNKGEEGIFFLQRRLIQKDGEYIMVTPVTRVIKSCLFKEHASGLGPFGWTVANIQVLAQLVEYPPAMDVAVSVLYPYDKMGLGAPYTAAEIIAGVKAEDEAAAQGKKGRKNVKHRGNVSDAAARRRVLTTASILYDGDPTKIGLFKGDGEGFNAEYIDKVLSAIRQSVLRTGVRTLVNRGGSPDLEVDDNDREEEI